MVLKDKSDKIYIKNSSIRENNLILKINSGLVFTLKIY